MKVENRTYNTSLNIKITKVDDKVKYLPTRLKLLTIEGKRSTGSLIIQNTGEVNQTFSISVPSYLANTLRVDMPTVVVPAGTSRRVVFTITGGEYAYVADYITLKRSYSCREYEDNVPLIISPALGG